MREHRRTGRRWRPCTGFVLWLVPMVEKLPRRQKFLLGDRLQATALEEARHQLRQSLPRDAQLADDAGDALMPAEGVAPKPIRIGSRAVRWVGQEVLDFIASGPASWLRSASRVSRVNPRSARPAVQGTGGVEGRRSACGRRLAQGGLRHREPAYPMCVHWAGEGRRPLDPRPEIRRRCAGPEPPSTRPLPQPRAGR